MKPAVGHTICLLNGNYTIIIGSGMNKDSKTAAGGTFLFKDNKRTNEDLIIAVGGGGRVNDASIQTHGNQEKDNE